MVAIWESSSQIWNKRPLNGPEWPSLIDGAWASCSGISRFPDAKITQLHWGVRNRKKSKNFCLRTCRFSTKKGSFGVDGLVDVKFNVLGRIIHEVYVKTRIRDKRRKHFVFGDAVGLARTPVIHDIPPSALANYAAVYWIRFIYMPMRNFDGGSAWFGAVFFLISGRQSSKTFPAEKSQSWKRERVLNAVARMWTKWWRIVRK